MKYYIITGEASGDLHASNLMKGLAMCDGEARFRFTGGQMMTGVARSLLGNEKASDKECGLVKHYKEMAYMGFIPVLLHAKTILENMKGCKDDIVTWKPDVLILVDYPGFNLNIAKFIHANTDIPIFYYISPKIWAWKEYRLKSIARDVDVMFSILPFEVDYFRETLKKPKFLPKGKTEEEKAKNTLSLDVRYVGNPCVDAINDFLHSEEGKETFADFCEANSLEPKPVIAILPGSRKQEIKDNLYMMVEAATEFDNDYQIVIAGAPGIEGDFYKDFIPEDSRVTIIFDQTYRILHQATAALVTSGTATLETAIMGIPQVVCYYIAFGKLVSILRSLILKVKYISLVNLVAGKEIVKELVADGMTTENVKVALYDILPGSGEREKLIKEYERMNAILGNAGASMLAARQMYDWLKK